jgi:hypothetical protein
MGQQGLRRRPWLPILRPLPPVPPPVPPVLHSRPPVLRGRCHTPPGDPGEMFPRENPPITPNQPDLENHSDPGVRRMRIMCPSPGPCTRLCCDLGHPARFSPFSLLLDQSLQCLMSSRFQCLMSSRLVCRDTTAYLCIFLVESVFGHDYATEALQVRCVALFWPVLNW